MRKKWCFLSAILLSCLACFGISEHANAIVLNIPVSPTGTEYANPKVACSGPAYNAPWINATTGNQTYCIINSYDGDDAVLRGIKTRDSYDVTKDNYYTIYLEVRREFDGYVSNTLPMTWTVQPFPDDYFTLIGLTEEYNQSGVTAFTQYSNVLQYEFDNAYSNMFAITVKAKKTGSTIFQLGNQTQILINSNRASFGSEPPYYQVRINRIVEYEKDNIAEGVEEGVEKAQEKEKEEIQDASDDGEDAADDASSGAESATQNLTGAITDIVDVFRNAQPSNCKISLVRGNFNTGELDLCAVPNQIKTMIQVFIAIPITLSVLRVSYSMVMFYLNRIRKEQE